jgi:hypothetical protein
MKDMALLHNKPLLVLYINAVYSYLHALLN